MKGLSLIATVFVYMAFASLAQAEVDLDYSNVLKLGGDTTIHFQGESVRAYRNPAVNLTEDQVAAHLAGDALFERNFSDNPTRPLKGLGPVYNNTSCISCHAKDGRGALPIVPAGQEWVAFKQNESIFLRISIENEQTKNVIKSAENSWGAPVPVPGFSDQLFHLGSYGVREDLPGVGQARVWMKYEHSEFTYPDGEIVSLRKPLFKITDAYDEVALPNGTLQSRLYSEDVKISPRMSQPMFGLGLLEAIKESDIIKLSSRDLRHEGIAGKVNWVFDIEKFLSGHIFPVSMGRFGLKNNTPTVMHQSLGALRGDIGVTNYAFPEESILGTPLYDNYVQSSGNKVEGLETTNEISDSLVFYSQTLAVPSRRNIDDPEVIRGGRIFNQVGCASCHHPRYVTGSHPIQAFSQQTIYPFTDMLLHDMGDELADGRQDFDANGRQWKTRPLWGIGQTQTVNPRAGFLHDGRARTVEEAILWHGGEGSYSRKKFSNLSKDERAALVRFIKSL